MKRYLAGLLIKIFILTTVFGQESFPGLDNIIPPSPDAGALMKGVSVPVSYYTGIPSVSIPLWTMKGRKLSIPISLSYHASGIKVEEIAGWTGLGWSLNAGGAISRTVRGVPDDKPLGFLTLHGNLIPEIQTDPDALGRWEIPGEDENAKIEYLKRIARNLRDGEPDIFQFNFNGRSGKFYFNVNGEVILLSKENLKIIFVKDADGLIYSWQIVDEGGTIYTFGTSAAIERTAPANATDQPGEYYTSTWFLQSVKSPNEEDLFWFEYEDYSKAVKYSVPQRKISGNDPVWEDMFKYQLQFVEGKHLKKITYPGGQVNLSSEKIYAYPGGEIRGLTEIKIKDRRTGFLIKTFRFNYSFFPSVGCGTQRDYLPPCRRLRLDKIREIPGEGEEKKPPYMFFYDETPLPPRGSFSRDHWGFYNGAKNDYLVPAVTVWNTPAVKQPGSFKTWNEMVSFADLTDVHLNLPDVNEGIWEFSGADREPDPSVNQAGMLKKIVYPTGGSTILEYESHDFGYLPVPVMKQDTTFEIARKYAGNTGEYEWNFHLIEPQEISAIPLFFIVAGSVKDRSEETLDPSDFSEVYIKRPISIDSDGDTLYRRLYRTINEIAGGMENEDKVWLDTGLYKVGLVAKDVGDITRLILKFRTKPPYDTVYKIFSQEYQNESEIAGNKYFPDDISEYRSEIFNLDSMDYPLVHFSFFFRSRIHPNRISTIGLEHPFSKVVVTKIGVNPEVVFEKIFYDDDLISWNGVNEEWNYEGTVKRLLKRGRYQIEFIPRIDSEFGYVKVNWKKSQKINTYKIAGGLRIKRMIEKDGDKDTLGITDYKYTVIENGVERSSGILMSYPVYYDIPQAIYYMGSNMAEDLDNLPLTLYSLGKEAAGNTSGSHIGYSRVTVSRPGTGREEYDFSSAIDYPDISSKEFPFPPVVSYDWKRGLLKEKRVYRENGKLRQKEAYNYNDVNDTINKVLLPAIRVVQENPGSEFAFVFKKYYMPTGWNITRKKEISTYDLEGGNSVEVKEEYTFDPSHLQLVQTRRWESDNKETINQLIYPDDLKEDVDAEIEMLQSKHMVNVVLNMETFKNEKRISGQKTVYGIFHTNKIFPKTIEKLEGEEYYPVIHFDNYDDKGNLIQYHREGDVFNSFNWDQDQLFPIAKVVNSEYVEDIQNYSTKALVTKYSYHPFWGIRKETGPNGISTYYNYDNYGRITDIRNNEQKILKSYEYHLKSYDGDTSRPGFSSKELVFSVNPDGISASKTSVVRFCGVSLQVSGGLLGTGAEWVWYDDFCGGNEIGRGSVINIYPSEEKQYYVRAEGEANKTSCADIFISIETPSLHPVPDALTFEDFGTDHNLVEVNLNYNGCDPLSIESDMDWLFILNVYGVSFSVECKPNTTGSARQGHILVVGNNVKLFIQVMQSGPDGF